MKLHAEVLRPGGREGVRRAVVMLHGILGSGNNLRGIARQFIERTGSQAAVLIDLRAHGNSQAAPENADTVANAATDVVETLHALELDVQAVVGHSFGGKVALAMTGLSIRHVMTLDSAPGPRPDARGSESTFEVLRLLHALRGPWASREAFVDELVANGQPRPIAQWLAMNVERRGAGYEFKLSMARIDALIDDYLNVDVWDRVGARAGCTHHLVIADGSRVYEHDDRVRAQMLESSGASVTVDVLGGGHWIHVDDPAGVVDVMVTRLG